MNSIPLNLHQLRRDILEHALASGRDPQSITLVAVSKTKPVSDILAAWNAGQNDFGENYAQEFRDKIAEAGVHPQRHWHFIGPLQSNKAKYVVGQADLIHTLDRISLAEEIQRLCKNKNLMQDCLVEVKLAEESSKHGCASDELPELLKGLKQFDRIRVKGLMTIATASEDHGKIRAEFKKLRELRDNLNQLEVYPTPLTELSMGMSSDWREAVAEGATILRIGSLIFGKR